MEAKELIKSLKKAGISEAEIAAAMDVSTKTIQNWENGIFGPRAGKLRKLSELVYTSHQMGSRVNRKQELSSWPGVPIYDTEVTGGLLNLIRDEQPTDPIYYLPIPGFRDCKFGARVSGDSMYPEIRNGDFVICKEVSLFVYGDIYLVVTEDGQETVKHVHPHENPDYVTLVPSNKDVPATPIEKAKIKKFYKVKGVIKGY